MASSRLVDDIYDFSGVASDLAILRSQLLTLRLGQQKQQPLLSSKRSSGGSALMTTAMEGLCSENGTKSNQEDTEDDEEW